MKKDKPNNKINEMLLPGWNERQSDLVTNAQRMHEDLLARGHALDASIIENADFDHLVGKPVYDYKGNEIGIKYEPKR